jgi:hypothetical protein
MSVEFFEEQRREMVAALKVNTDRGGGKTPK